MENEWIKVEDRLPDFDDPVFVYCKIWGRYIATYTEILDTGWGEWRDFNNKPCLPPTHWMPLPKPPTE